MKKRGIIASALGVLLSSIGCSNNVNIINTYKYDNADEYLEGSFHYSKNEVKEVVIDWMKGKVDIKQTDDDVLFVSESGTELLDEEKLHYLFKDEVLYIRFCKSEYNFIKDDELKYLSVQIPKDIVLNASTISAGVVSESLDLPEISLSTLSGNINIDTIKSPTLNVSVSSGNIDINSINTQRITISSMSGDISNDYLYARNISISSSSGKNHFEVIKCNDFSSSSMSGECVVNDIEAKEANINTSSGNVTVGIRDLEKLVVSTMSGSVDISLKGECGITTTYSSLSGKINAEGFIVEDDQYVFGNRKCEANVNTSSGNLCLSKE